MSSIQIGDEQARRNRLVAIEQRDALIRHATAVRAIMRLHQRPRAAGAALVELMQEQRALIEALADGVGHDRSTR